MEWDPALLEAAAREREVALTTFGRRTGRPHRVVMWISGDGSRLFVRSGGGAGRDWPRNLLARADAVLHVGGRDVEVRARHLTDPAAARSVSDLVARKYGTRVRRSGQGEPLTPGEQATFELRPRGRGQLG